MSTSIILEHQPVNKKPKLSDCTKFKSYPHKKTDKYYAVRLGHQPGIYRTWSECELQVKHFKGAIFKKFDTKKEAESFLKGDDTPNDNVNTNNESNTNENNKNDNETIKEHILQDNIEEKNVNCSMDNNMDHNMDHRYDNISKIYTDGAFNGKTKPNGWGCVTNELGQCILERYLKVVTSGMNVEIKLLPVGTRFCILAQFKDSEKQQNNGAELLALVAGLRFALCQKPGTVKEIYSDSTLLLHFWSQGKVNREKLQEDKLYWIDILIELRKRFLSPEFGGKLLKINGNENPADLGYHINK